MTRATRTASIYMWGTTGIGYDAAKVAAIMPDAPVDSWSLVFDPKVIAAKFKDCGVSVLEDPTDMVATMLLWLGKDPNSERAADLELAQAKLLAIRPYITHDHSSSTPTTSPTAKFVSQSATAATCCRRRARGGGR